VGDERLTPRSRAFRQCCGGVSFASNELLPDIIKQGAQRIAVLGLPALKLAGFTTPSVVASRASESETMSCTGSRYGLPRACQSLKLGSRCAGP
jgi:hypothetical protein